MAKRKIIKIDEDKCDGCGKCIPACPEGAMRVIDGKARLISDLFCDGLGACIGHCPKGAIIVEEREAEKYDERKVMENIVKKGPNVIKAHLDHFEDHSEFGYLNEAVLFLKEKGIDVPNKARKERSGRDGDAALGGCPGARSGEFEAAGRQGITDDAEEHKAVSRLRQWPVQLNLLSPNAPFFRNADLVVAADCVSFACGDFHERFLKGKTIAILCPKLDRAMENAYGDKLAAIFRNNDIKSVTIVHMEVPCCYGTVPLVENALKKSGKKIRVSGYTISLRGEVIREETI